VWHEAQNPLWFSNCIAVMGMIKPNRISPAMTAPAMTGIFRSNVPADFLTLADFFAIFVPFVEWIFHST
jgi:hypothetical protein